jgi:predicted NBD/HSP70 family sugar kinase
MRSEVNSALGGPAAAGRQIRTAKPSSIRDVNRAIILNLIRLHSPVSRAELSERTGIFRSNVSEIVEQLIKAGLVREERAVPVGRGRVPFHLYLNDTGFRVLGVSVRPDQTQVAYAGLSGEIQKSLSFPTPEQPDQLMNGLRGAIKKMRGWIPEHPERPWEQLCVSMPGLVDANEGKILWIPAMPSYSGFPLKAHLEKLAGVEVSVDNDSNLAALAEMWMEDKGGISLNNFVFVEIGDIGVGAGVILKHEIYRGHDSTFIAEFGHMVVDPAGPRCSCGRLGCWELFVANRATWERVYTEKFEPGRFHTLVDAARHGDAAALDSARRTAEHLSIGLANIVMAFNPEVVIVAGRITEIWDLIQPIIEQVPMRSGVRLNIRPARLETDTLFLQGAVSFAVSKAFAQPDLGW